MKKRIEYLLLLTLIKISKILPPSFMYSFFDYIALFLFKILKSRRKIAISNLQQALHIDEISAYKIAKQNFQSIAKTAIEAISIYNDDFDFEKNIKNKELIKQTFEKLSENGSTLIITAHFGNWEVLSHYIAKIGFPQLVISREGDNELIEKNITKPLRQKFGNILAYKNEAMSKMVKHLKNGGLVGLLTDLNAGATNSIRNTFFGIPCYTAKSVSSLVLRYNIPIVAIFLRRDNDNRYEAIIRELKFDLTGNKEKDTQNITQICNDVIEEIIKTAPHQWFWMHNRWRVYDDV